MEKGGRRGHQVGEIGKGKERTSSNGSLDRGEGDGMKQETRLDWGLPPPHLKKGHSCPTSPIGRSPPSPILLASFMMTSHDLNGLDKESDEGRREIIIPRGGGF